MTTAQIRLRHVSKVFETQTMETHALRDISLTIYQGDYVAITGPSGCGKSTLLSVLGLLDSVTSGDYELDGVNLAQVSLDQMAQMRNLKLGFIFQSFNLIDELSVLDNVILPLRYAAKPLSKDEMYQQAKACLNKVGLSHREDHKPNQLSGGQQQRVAIARALVTNPEVLLVDEPTGNLDSKSGNQVMQLLGELNQQGTTICLVTHDYRYADMAKRKLQMLDGAILTHPVEETA
ncbi:ABC transporter ATP-binding protein [Neptunicella marina]|uniref:ABC transporter ATP-binding protein n=1 Tax=Neptunicella marina TaxID=2125989 RepID=A0A8J6IRN6_9ALTE|nr:ABC transporter ATP-binding protein [Neptunicella marina]MBC3765541.1 ABC transporter ATP-binding protein [Neptunicella marina]